MKFFNEIYAESDLETFALHSLYIEICTSISQLIQVNENRIEYQASFIYSLLEIYSNMLTRATDPSLEN